MLLSKPHVLEVVVLYGAKHVDPKLKKHVGLAMILKFVHGNQMDLIEENL